MPSENYNLSKFIVDLSQVIGAICAVVALYYAAPYPVNLYAIGSILLLISGVMGISAARRWNEWRSENVLKKNLPSEFYIPATIRRSTQHYLPPYCAKDDPAHLDLAALKKLKREKLFRFTDFFLSDNSPDKFMMLLGDSGTGKTSFVLNYFARNQRRWRWRRYPITVIPLGEPEVLKYIDAIDDEAKRKTVLFLDGFDEDVAAFENPVERLRELWEHSQKFHRVIITCRSQFFYSEETLPRETHIRYHGPKVAGTPAVFRNDIRYILPFDDRQVKQYIRRRYPIWRWWIRRRVFNMVKKIPRLSVRPMLLGYIPELIVNDNEYQTSFALYDEMVNAWLLREKGVLEDVTIEALREFSERLAVDLYTHSETRGAAHIHHADLEPLAQEWEINLNKWQMSSRSLLNRDAGGYYKFAHRSIMEFLIVKRYVKGDKNTRNISWSDQMQTFVLEAFPLLKEHGKYIPFSLEEVDVSRYGIKKPLHLRNQPIEELTENQIKEMLKKYNFFDSQRQKNGKGLAHDYRSYDKAGGRVVIDYSTNLMWQQSGSDNSMVYKGAGDYIKQLNQDKYAGYDDWRLPTLEEAMSLMEARMHGELYIDPVFDRKQTWIWTSDQTERASAAWFVSFDLGYCFSYGVVGSNYVRAVRFGQSSR